MTCGIIFADDIEEAKRFLTEQGDEVADAIDMVNPRIVEIPVERGVYNIDWYIE